MKVRRLLSILTILAFAVLPFVVISCQRDPEPEAFAMPSFVNLTSELTFYGCILRCEVSSSENVKSCGFLFGTDEMKKLEGTFVSDKVFEAEVTQYTPGTIYTFQAYVSNGSSEVKSQKTIWTVPSKPSDNSSSATSIRDFHVEEAEGGCLLRCRFISANPDLIESVKFSYQIEGMDIKGEISGKLTSDNEFEALMTGLSSETVYNFEAVMQVGGESFHSKPVSWTSPSFSDFVNVEAFWKKDRGKSCIFECETLSLDGVDSYGFYLWDVTGIKSEKYWGEKTGANTFNANTDQNDDTFWSTSRQKYYLQAYIVKGEYEYRSKLKEWTAPDFEKSVYIDETYVYFIDGLCSLSSTVHTPSEDAIVDGYFLFGKTDSELERFDADGELSPDYFGNALLFQTVVKDFVPEDDYNFQVVVVTNEGTVSTDVLLCQVYSDETNERFMKVEAHRNPHDGNLCFIGELSSMSSVDSCGFVFGTEEDILERKVIGATSLSGNMFGYVGPSNVDILPDTEYFLQGLYYGDPNLTLGNYSFPVKVTSSSMEKDFTTILETSISEEGGTLHLGCRYFSTFPQDVTSVGFMFGKEGSTLQKVDAAVTSPYTVEATINDYEPGMTYEFKAFVIIEPHEGYSGGTDEVYSEAKRWTVPYHE